ncbi:hypothetical protein V5O48_000308 [Marasmius crinis-equi]|uniref:SCP domain-containing protein n=1 Tax=Marasmius crinis-equi TaxID=585013 RepID=A0ABR3G2P0_9AGAR
MFRILYTLISSSLFLLVHASPGPEEYLKLHNDIRADRNAPPLTWNNDLAMYAQEWANRCVRRHSHGEYGENLAWGYGEDYGVEAAVQFWINERNYLDPSSPQASHYTQMIWKDTKELGCAVSWCPYLYSGEVAYRTGQMHVCEYFPRGNVIDDFQDNVE